jgi:hypothetical protein
MGADVPPTYFASEWAHYFIFGCALLSIVWGVFNVLMIRSVNLDDPEPIEAFFKEELGGDSVNADEERGSSEAK